MYRYQVNVQEHTTTTMLNQIRTIPGLHNVLQADV